LTTIKLVAGEWAYDERSPLGPAGGFGEVFSGMGPDGPVAIKRLKIGAAAAAHRELSIGAELAGRTFDHVVPVLDFGQDANSDRYYLVMPVCERSLQQEIAAHQCLSLGQARGVALDVMRGLEEVGEIVHRDLKPGNVLFHQGRWRIADFGIAKFVEDSTSIDTLRESLTPGYAAPEQWKGERPGKPTDIYALGCIMHAMLRGAPPFAGDLDNVRDGHLHRAPPSLDEAGGRLAALVSQMLRKSPASRPSLERCLSVFSEAGTDVGPENEHLAAAAQVVAAKRAAEEAATAERLAIDREWAGLISEASAEYENMVERVMTTVRNFSDEAVLDGRTLSFGEGKLGFTRLSTVQRAAEGPNLQHSRWTVALFGAARVQVANQYTFGATLCYAKTPSDPNFRWRELSFFSWSGRGGGRSEPFDLPPDRDFDFALAPITHSVQLAHGPLTIDGEDEAGFRNRWITLLTKAATNSLQPPSSLPLQDGYFR